MKAQKVMDRKRVADNLHAVLDAGVAILQKEGDYTASDHSKIKLIRIINGSFNAAVAMIQQETAQERIAVILARMKQLGYDPPDMDR